MTYASTASLDDIADRLHQASRILCLTHRKPDGDAAGSCLAMKRALTTATRHVDIMFTGDLPDFLPAIAGETAFERVEHGEPDDQYDVILVMDTGAWSQVQPLDDWLRSRTDQIIGIDHHAHGDDIAGQRYVDTTAASTTQILLDLLSRMDVTLGGDRDTVAEALFVGLATDTGWFRHPNGDAAAFAAASRLLAAGVNKPRLYQLIEETARPERLALLGRALGSLRRIHHGRVALMTLTPADFAETGGAPSDLTGVVNEPLCVPTIRASILVTSVDDSETKFSFRSKPAPDGGSFIDVNAVAQELGGGGHVHAAGARRPEACTHSQAAVEEALRVASPMSD